jgi:hypothetical protein
MSKRPFEQNYHDFMMAEVMRAHTEIAKLTVENRQLRADLALMAVSFLALRDAPSASRRARRWQRSGARGRRASPAWQATSEAASR